jgi:transposase
MIVIGIDTHIATCDYVVVNELKLTKDQGTFTTSAPNLRELVGRFREQEIVVVIEQGNLTDWIYRVLKISGAKIIVSETRRNRWIAQDNTKNDRFDAQKLAMLYLGGFIKEVVQRDEKNELILRLCFEHHDLVQQRTRIKNQIKSKFKQDGIWAKGSGVYNPQNRKSWVEQIKNPTIVPFNCCFCVQFYPFLILDG